MTWHGQINRTIWEIESRLEKDPGSARLRRELLRTHFLQRYEFDRTVHIPRDDRSFLFLQEKQAPAFLLLHGAAGTPAEMRNLGSYLYGKGYTTYCPRLSRYDIKDRMVTWESWVTGAENALTTMLRYSKKTGVIGLSFGGTVALTLDQLHKIDCMVLLAPALHVRMGFKNTLLTLARRITPTLFYHFAGWNGEVIKAMEHVRRSGAAIETPTLAFQAKDDHLLSAKGLKLLAKRFRNESSDGVLLKDGSHALTRGKAKDEIFERILEFAQAQLGAGKGGQRRGRRGRRGSEAESADTDARPIRPVEAAVEDKPERPARRSRGRRGGRRNRERRERQAARDAMEAQTAGSEPQTQGDSRADARGTRSRDDRTPQRRREHGRRSGDSQDQQRPDERGQRGERDSRRGRGERRQPSETERAEEKRGARTDNRDRQPGVSRESWARPSAPAERPPRTGEPGSPAPRREPIGRPSPRPEQSDAGDSEVLPKKPDRLDAPQPSQPAAEKADKPEPPRQESARPDEPASSPRETDRPAEQRPSPKSEDRGGDDSSPGEQDRDRGPRFDRSREPRPRRSPGAIDRSREPGPRRLSETEPTHRPVSPPRPDAENTSESERRDNDERKPSEGDTRRQPDGDD